MKKTMLVVLMFAVVVVMSFAELNNQSQVIKKNMPAVYTCIKQDASQKWGNDYGMIVYEINKQSEAFFNIITIINSVNGDDAKAGILQMFLTFVDKWTTAGYDAYNQKILNIGNTDNNMLALHVDWTMIEYDMENQLKAMGALQ